MQPSASPLQAEPVGLRSQGFDVPRMWIIRFIAMQINLETTFSGDFAEPADRGRPVGPCSLEMRNTADYFYPKIQRSEQILFRIGRPKQTILGKCHQLEIEVGSDLPFNLEQCFHRQQTIVTNVDMTSDRQQSLGNGHIAIS